MGYDDTTGVILYFNPDQPFLSTDTIMIGLMKIILVYPYKTKRTIGYLLLQQNPEIILHGFYLLDLISFELYITSTTFCDTTILTYEIELTPAVKKICFNLLNYGYFTIPYVVDTISNSPAGHQLPKHSKKNVCIIAINGKETITYQGELEKL